MIKTKRIVILFIVSIVVAAIWWRDRAASRPVVTSLDGTIAVMPNPRLKQTVVVVSLPTGDSKVAKQVIFRLQTYLDVEPSYWKGTGNVLVGKGFLAVLPTGGASPWIMYLKGEEPPSSVAGVKIEEFLIYGISRFDFNGQLSNTALANLYAGEKM